MKETRLECRINSNDYATVEEHNERHPVVILCGEKGGRYKTVFLNPEDCVAMAKAILEAVERFQ